MSKYNRVLESRVSTVEKKIRETSNLYVNKGSFWLLENVKPPEGHLYFVFHLEENGQPIMNEINRIHRMGFEIVDPKSLPEISVPESNYNPYQIVRKTVDLGKGNIVCVIPEDKWKAYLENEPAQKKEHYFNYMEHFTKDTGGSGDDITGYRPRLERL